MNRGFLANHFRGVGVKKLSAVDSEPSRSNQHEIGPTKAMRSFLGEDRVVFDVSYVWMADENETITANGSASYYNSREGKPRAPEFRLYYPSNAVTELMKEGDTLFLAKLPNLKILFIVVPSECTLQGQLLWLFGFDEQPEMKFLVRDFTEGGEGELDFVSRFILDEIGVELEDPNANTIDKIVDRYASGFPSTKEFSALARLTLPGIDASEDPDAALMAWLNHEEAMFRRLEHRLMKERLEKGFINDGDVDVDGFIAFSLSVQNRRKSRMGRSFENHLGAVFDAMGIRYEEQVITENGKKPDFVFPGSAEYVDRNFNPDLLTMLAAKSTCKDRWPQVLPEAERIERKHLATLELGISETQTTMMEEANVQLVVPLDLQSSYSSRQSAWIWSVADFAEHVLEIQHHV